MFAVPVATEPTLTIGRPSEVFQGRYFFGSPHPEYDVTADGQRFLLLEADAVATRHEVVGHPLTMSALGIGAGPGGEN